MKAILTWPGYCAGFIVVLVGLAAYAKGDFFRQMRTARGGDDLVANDLC
ncbi:MAG: hypothetical protein WBO00_03885 [Steroidobacteraceae bacterium]